MGLFSNASEVDASEAVEGVGELLLDGEEIETVFSIMRDQLIFDIDTGKVSRLLAKRVLS